MATATKTARSLKVLCPFCLAGESITLDLNDLRACVCSNCSEEFSPQDALAKANELVAKWSQVVAWIESAPAGS
ncbi:hypothetical protein SAMN05444166_1880 [Singulisphaera sp. GP187]|uniref:hypothetical protein n=1 Tax=Singulisphaera sp. GP187 TaxID=1882752 RepID=UPI000927BF85|nr:hypothetical protein [Singulisphaera sp. GP187]SIN97837.1 hypothetical protein SAMN05444166_1880 [Singulisphaera sp. GP187]